ncbi:cell division protein FtsX [Sphingobium lignivorans]|uniref:Cell division transport system permease protein n=1 Tax=Sphingobium lignivorans TaxID=2735886 RepID=A0ABR6NAV7_9SPHN|nr:FtsX-like permease family protein [Sphingobium lignivorans]MBB5984417.1 cell division transport system permease protein [Sphingobium lignivorans]
MAREQKETPNKPYAPGSLLPQGRLTGPMPWVIAIMMFLTVLAAAAGIALNHAAFALRADVSDRLTIQIAEADPEVRGRAVRSVVTLLEQTEGVGNVEVIPEARLAAQLTPWLGSDLRISDIPLPALIDADLVASRAERDSRIADLDKAVKAISAQARVEPHAAYLAPLARLVGAIGLLSFGVVALVAIATGAVVVLAARGAHATHRGTIDIMHMLGATDAQVVRLFQQRMMLDALFGAVIGFTCAIAVIILVGRSMAAVASDLIQSVSLPGFAWVLLPLLPLAGVAVAWLSARVTLQRALQRSL